MMAKCFIKIPSEAIIAKEKLTRYLLVPRGRGDKSRFLAQAGFTQENPDALMAAIRLLIEREEAAEGRVDEDGTFYNVAGELTGPNRRVCE